MELTEALENFLLQLEADGRSPHTIGQYRRHVVSLAAWLSQQAHSGAVADVGHETLARFLASTAARTRPDGAAKKPTSVNAMRSSLRGFFCYAHKAGYIARDPSHLIRRARAEAPPPRGVTENETERVLASIDGADGEAARRDGVLIRLMSATGVRLSSALAINVDDLDLDGGEARIRRLKGGGEQVVFLPEEVRYRLAKHIGDRRTGPLFLGRDGRRLGHRQAQRRFAEWVERAGLRGRVSPHCLRHGFAMALYERTGDLLVVQKALGHRSISSTLVYAHADTERVRAAVLAG